MDSPQVRNAGSSPSPDCSEIESDRISEVGLDTIEKVAKAVLKKQDKWHDFNDLKDKLMKEMM